MKKLIAYISALITLFVIGTITSTAFAQVNIDELIEEASQKPREGVSQDMYLQMYKEINEGPAEKAAKSAADKLGMSEDEIKKVAREGDISALTKNDPEIKLEDVTKKYSKAVQEYQTALGTENLKADLEQTVKPSEIFVDGDTSNSEFDLLYDLTIIEVILFNKASVSEFGGEFIMPDFDFTDPDEKAEIEELFGGDDIFDEDALEAIEAQEDKEFSAIECLEDDESLQNALDNYADQHDDRARIDVDGTILDGDYVLGEDGFPKAEPDEWPVKFLCPDGAFFCIEIEFDITTSTVYAKTDNCIACHIQKINEEIDSMLDKSLSANKVSGQLFEVNKCKSAFTNVGANMNVITTAVPPPGQAKTDAYVQLNIDKEWQKFNEAFRPFFYDTDAEQPEQNQEDRSIRKALSNLSPGNTIEEVVQRSDKIVQREQNDATKTQETKEKETKTEVQNKEFQSLYDELNNFKTYFKSIKEQFDKMIEPCNELATKQYCS